MTRILGIDPGLDTTGYGIIDESSFAVIEAGVIRTVPKDHIQDRVRKIYESVSEIIKEHAPQVMVLEKIFTHHGLPSTSILMGHARGVICLACGMNGVRLVSYPPARVKFAVTGHGRATKAQMQRTVQSYLKLKELPKPPDVADALALAITYVFHEKRGLRLSV